MSHTAQNQSAKRKHFPTPDGNERVLQLLECLRSGQVEPDQFVAHVAAGDLAVEHFSDKRAAA